MTILALLLGVVIAGATFAGFRLYGPDFFTDGRTPFQLNFAAGAAIGLVVGLIGPWIIGARGPDRTRAAILIALPGLIGMAVVTSHFGVFFRSLPPVMDKVFGALMLWGYAFLLAGSLVRRRR
ncbi:MAG: DUF5367 family protein [Alsobacter sp.]